MNAAREADLSVNVSEVVKTRDGHARWVVIATFVDVNGSEPRCIEYRVRVVPKMGTKAGAMLAAKQINAELQADTVRPHPDCSTLWLAAELSAPAEGIPQRVFDEASQSRLLSKARQLVKAHPQVVNRDAARLLERQSRRRVGRPPVRSLGEKLAILQSVEKAFAANQNLESVARSHNLSRSAVRDLISWARRDADPQLFTSFGPGRRGGELTAVARALLKDGGKP